MTTLYGISNCDTVRKARKWLDANGIDYRFHDFRKDGLSAECVARWCDTLGSAAVLNKRGTTWRALDAAQQQEAGASESALRALLLTHPTLIKRPVLEQDAQIRIGFSAQDYSELFGL